MTDTATAVEVPDRRFLNDRKPNGCRIRRPGVTVSIVEDEGDMETIFRACRDACLGLGFSITSVNQWFGEMDG